MVNIFFLLGCTFLKIKYFAKIFEKILYWYHRSKYMSYNLNIKYLPLHYLPVVFHGKLNSKHVHLNTKTSFNLLGSLDFLWRFPYIYIWYICIYRDIYVIVWTMSTGKEVSKKSTFPTSFDLSTVFKEILWMWTCL